MDGPCMRCGSHGHLWFRRMVLRHPGLLAPQPRCNGGFNSIRQQLTTGKLRLGKPAIRPRDMQLSIKAAPNTSFEMCL